MKIDVTPLRNGHFKIEAEFNGERLSAITTNTLAIDCLGEDEIFFDEDDRYYSSSDEAEEALLNEILYENGR